MLHFFRSPNFPALVLLLRGGGGGVFGLCFCFSSLFFFLRFNTVSTTFIEKCVKKRFFVEASKFRKQKKASKKVNRLFNQVSQRIQVWYIYLHLLDLYGIWRQIICEIYQSHGFLWVKSHDSFHLPKSQVQAAGTTQLYRGSRYSLPTKRPLFQVGRRLFWRKNAGWMSWSL